MITFKKIFLDDLNNLAVLYAQTFNAPPWNDKWTTELAAIRLRQMINTPDGFGLCAYDCDTLVGAVIGAYEQFYDGVVYNLKEFWVKNDTRRQGIGSKLYKQLELQLKENNVKNIFLITSRSEETLGFYAHQGIYENRFMTFLSKDI